MFAGGDVSSSDDWAEVGAVGPDTADAQGVDDELAALAELSWRDDSSFGEALRGGRGAARRFAGRSPSPQTGHSFAQSADDEVESIALD